MISTTSTTASVRFTETWSAASFRDRGPKELRLVRSASGLRIASEAMLESTVDRGRAFDLDASELRFVVHTRNTYVVLDFAGQDEHGDGPPLLDTAVTGAIAARKAVKTDALSSGVKAAISSRVRLYDSAGIACRARVRTLPAYRAIAKKYAQYLRARADAAADSAATPHWEHYDGATPRFAAWRSGERTFVGFKALVGGCGDFGGTLWVLYEAEGEQLRLLNRPGNDREPSAFSIGAILDANQDGAIEILGSSWKSAERETDILLLRSASAFSTQVVGR